jgi:hypothetical protein
MFGTAICFGLALLTAETAHFGHGHALHAGLHQGLAHVLQPERLDDGRDELHAVFLSPSVMA